MISFRLRLADGSDLAVISLRFAEFSEDHSSRKFSSFVGVVTEREVSETLRKPDGRALTPRKAPLFKPTW